MTTDEKKPEDASAADQTQSAAKPALLGRLGAAFAGHGPSELHAGESKTANELAEERTSLAIKRTLMGADRTLMAWVRTALSMIGFGFTIYKVLQGLQGGEGAVLAQKFDPRNVGLFLVGLGTLSMVMGTIEYWYTIKGLRRLELIRITRRPSFVMAMIISVAGLVVFLSIIAELL